MAVLILKNIPAEGPGTIEDFLAASSTPYRIVDLASDAFPDADAFDTLVMMGGPMSVNDLDDYAFLRPEIDLAADFMKQGKKVFGVCLGAQIMARALGSPVYPGKQKEIGWYDIEVVDGGLRDPLMNRLATHPTSGDCSNRFSVFHWHGETFDIPAGADRLASSELFPNQAFRYGSSYAFQFHIEVKKDMIYEWLAAEPVDQEALRAVTEHCYAAYHGRAMNFYAAFFGRAAA